MKLDGKVVVVTGGGSGIGQELVLALLARGARVAAVDLRMDGLKETQTRAKAGDRLSLHEANIADREAVMALPDAIETAHGAVDALINNAGIIQPFEDFNDLAFDVIDRVVDVNFGGPINMTKAFLPRLMARPEAHLVNVASMGAFIPFPGQTMYSATKAGVKLMTEGIYAELMNSRVDVSVVMPGAVNTHITENSGVKMSGSADASGARMTSAPDAARIILDGMEAGKLHILVGSDSKMLFRLVRLAPTWAIGFIQKQMAKMAK
ncbi:SDR family NAD(P)-dependent oxidoreductase [Maritimibacter sp. UBA3975]|uniref:SDR family NAD(P)-dependent oxidoreductase n=1 Tax=Maritimibacter sp. UBA3975 TaxID=1946833 RepID=UPI000C0AFCDC|nr:SDR family NAD(P)-dependent oxidoreductase [Maritimibacter sp. UBA3975]MAM61960.1 short-chain dehydrogenase [Maritimibacter sp.]|tara:strand:- start:6214 stop:7008 length:795 start_codon:yes stop_codon:yes gene_type:complete